MIDPRELRKERVPVAEILLLMEAGAVFLAAGATRDFASTGEAAELSKRGTHVAERHLAVAIDVVGLT